MLEDMKCRPFKYLFYSYPATVETDSKLTI